METRSLRHGNRRRGPATHRRRLAPGGTSADGLLATRRHRTGCAARGNWHHGHGLGARNDQGNLFRAGEGLMIWYRHWVEMRLGVLLFAGLSLWLGFSIRGPWHSLEYGQALPLTPLGQAIGAEGVLVWAEFAGRILPFSLAASLGLSGAGFRTFFMPLPPVVYTLTLPISRTRLIWTRLAAALG